MSSPCRRRDRVLFEWVQDFNSFFWSEVEINQRLARSSLALARTSGIPVQQKVTLRTAAYIVACTRVLRARAERGLIPDRQTCLRMRRAGHMVCTTGLNAVPLPKGTLRQVRQCPSLPRCVARVAHAFTAFWRKKVSPPPTATSPYRWQCGARCNLRRSSRHSR